jgi:hypothetical protein
MEDNFGGTCFFKKVPIWLKQLPPEYLSIFLKAACDGYTRDNKNNSKYTRYSSVSTMLINDMQEIAFKCGYLTSIGKPEQYVTKDGRTETIHHLYFSWVDQTEFGLWLKHGEKQEDGTWDETGDNNSWKTEEYYKGKVYCLSVPNSFFVTRYGGKLSIHGNSISDRHATPRELWKIGEPTNPATDEELSNFAAMVANSYNDVNQCIVYHHAVSCDVIGTADKVLPLRQELDGVEEEMLIGLMLNKGFLDSNYGAYANMSVALDVLISRYLTFRQSIERWLRDAVWTPLCRIHNIYKPTQAEIAHRIRIKNPEKKPWTPSVSWTKHELRDNTRKIDLLLQLRDKLGKPGFPRDRIYQMVNENPREIKKLLDKEAKEQSVSKFNVNLGGGGGAAPSVGAGGGVPDLSLDLGGLGGGGGKADTSKMTEDQLPEFSGKGDTENINSRVVPPASAGIENEKSPTG